MQKEREKRKKIDDIFCKALKENVFSGAAFGINYPEKGKYIKKTKAYGYTSEDKIKKINKKALFDLASLTKALATTLSILALIKEEKINFNSCLEDIFSVKGEKKRIEIIDLLNHRSGFPAHRKYFEKLKSIPKEKRKEKMMEWVLEEELEYKTAEKSIYSDLGFMILGWIVESASGMGLEEYFNEKVLKPMKIKGNILFKPERNKFDFVATEKCQWRGKVIQGIVHDQNTCALGGVSGQAGLFGDIVGVLEMISFLRDMWKERRKHPNIDNKDLKKALTKQARVKESTWALGFDTPEAEKSSAGIYLSKRSVGHLGFTGTSFWIDPGRDLAIVLLTNRIHPNSDNQSIKEFRPLFHNTVIEEFNLL